MIAYTGRRSPMKEPHMVDPVLYQKRDHAAQLTLNRPHIHNALDRDMTQALGAALERAVADPDARIIVLTGAGPTFCAGLNLKGDGGAFTAAGGEGDLSPFQAVVKTLWECPKPLIGRIQGSAFGAGFGLVACCDIAVAVDSAQFAVTELRVGLPPTLIALILQHKNLIGAARPLTRPGFPRYARVPSLRAAPITPVDCPGCFYRLLPHGASAFPGVQAGRRPHQYLSRPAQDSLALRPAGLLASPSETLSPELRQARLPQARRPGGYRGEPTIPRAELSSAGTLRPRGALNADEHGLTYTSNDLFRGAMRAAPIGVHPHLHLK